MKHSLLTCFLLMTAVTLQIAAAQDTINQSSQVNFSPYAEWESADSAIARQNAYSAYLQSLCPPDTVYIVLITPDGLYFWLRVDPMVDKYLNASPLCLLQRESVEVCRSGGRNNGWYDFKNRAIPLESQPMQWDYIIISITISNLFM